MGSMYSFDGLGRTDVTFVPVMSFGWVGTYSSFMIEKLTSVWRFLRNEGLIWGTQFAKPLVGMNRPI
jgi:hypothetical protein